MKSRFTLKKITETIRTQFQEGPPNGWILGWDSSRCFHLISAAAVPYPVANHTSFDYGFCNWFQVRIDGENEECYWTLTIKISFIAPVYAFHWTQYGSKTQGRVIPAAPQDYQSVEDSVRLAVENSRFCELPVEWHDKELKGIELELSGSENVTVGKCLFSDYEG